MIKAFFSYLLIPDKIRNIIVFDLYKNTSSASLIRTSRTTTDGFSDYVRRNDHEIRSLTYLRYLEKITRGARDHGEK